MFGTLVVLYLFLGGCGAGIMLVTATWSLAFHRSIERSFAQTKAFDDMKARCFGAGFVVLCLAALCLLLDLGRPERMFMLFTRPTWSILTFGSYTLMANLLVGGSLVAANLLYLPFVHAPARKVGEVLCVVLSLLMMGYTGVYVGSIEAVALWFNPAVPVVFALSSLSAGFSLLFILRAFGGDACLLDERLLLLHRIHLSVLVCELVALVAFVGWAYFEPFAHESLAVLLSPSGMGPWFVVGLGCLGLIVPIVSEAVVVLMGCLHRFLLADVLCIAGGLILRFCVIWSGMH